MTSKRVLGILVMFLAVAAQSMMACPACKDGYGSNGANASIGDAYSWSILFMLGVPLTILTVFTVFVTRKIRQNPNGTPLM